VIFWRVGRRHQHLHQQARRHPFQARELRLDAPVGSPLPAQLTALGYDIEKTGTSERILAHAVAQKFETSSSRALIPATEGSTKAVTVTVTNAGIATVEQYDLRTP
jgi:hypothetical protein